MGFSLRDKFDEVAAQLKMGDARTASTVRKDRNVQAAQTLKKKQDDQATMNMLRQKANDRLQTQRSNGAINEESFRTRQLGIMNGGQPLLPPTIPKGNLNQNMITGGVRDFFDSDSDLDRLKRVSTGQDEMYRQQQQDMGNARPFENLGAQLMGNTARFANNTAAAISMIPSTVRGTAAQVTGNEEALINALEAQENMRNFALQGDSGLLKAGTIYDNPEEFKNMSAAETAKRVGLNTLGTASEILPYARVSRPVVVGGKVTGNALRAGGKTIPTTSLVGRTINTASMAERGASGLGARAAFNAGIDFTTGGGESVARQYAQTGNINPMTALVDAGASTIMGQAQLVPAYARAVGNTPTGKKAIKNTVKTAKVVNENANHGKIVSMIKDMDNDLTDIQSRKSTAFVNNKQEYNRLVKVEDDLRTRKKRLELKEKITRNRIGNSLEFISDETSPKSSRNDTGKIPTRIQSSMPDDKLSSQANGKTKPIKNTSAKLNKNAPSAFGKIGEEVRAGLEEYARLGEQARAQNRRVNKFVNDADSGFTGTGSSKLPTSSPESFVRAFDDKLVPNTKKKPNLQDALLGKSSKLKEFAEELKGQDGAIGDDVRGTGKSAPQVGKTLIPKESLAPNGRVKTAEVDNVFNSLPDGTVGDYGFVKKNGKIYPPKDATPELLKNSFIDLNPDGSVKEGFGITKMSFLDGVKDTTPVAQVGKTDPLANLKQEALKYKSVDEFADSLNAMKYGKVTGVGELPIEKINKTQVKALTERGLPHTDTNMKVSDFKPGRKVTQPLEVYSKGGSWVVENGNHRLAQALANGDKTIPVVFKGGEGKKYSTAIADLYNQAHTQVAPQVGKTPTLQDALAGKSTKVTSSDSLSATSPELSASSPRSYGQESAIQGNMPRKTKLENQVQLNSRQALPLTTNDTPKTTKVKLNTKRLNPDSGYAGLAEMDKQTAEVIERLSNKDLVRISKDAGIDVKTHSPEQIKKKITEQLNVRRDAVKYMNEAEAARKAGDLELAEASMLRAAEQGRISRAQGSELAQQLQARRIIANELDTPQQRIFKLLDAAGVNPEAYVSRLRDVDFSQTKQVVEAYRDLVPAKKHEWIDTLRYNSMLSSPLTQAVNVFGNAQGVLGVAPIEKTIRGTMDAIAGAFGKKRQYVAGEGLAYSKGSITNISNATKNFRDALAGAGKYANPDFQEYNIPLATKGVSGATYKTLSFPMRVLDGMDKFFRTLAEGGEESALDLRVKKGIELKGNKAALMEKEASYRVFQQELNESGQGVLNNAADEFASLVMRGRSSKNPIVSGISKFTVPFVKTINNINKQGIVDYSPVGFVNTIGNADKMTAITRATMGTAVFGLSGLLVGAGDMTWAEPRNPEEKAKFRADGKQPYAVRMGGKWYNFSKLHPSVAFPMAMTSALDDAMKNGDADQSQVDKILEAVAKYGNFMSDQSYAKSVGDTLGAIGGDKESIVRAVSNYPQQVVPFRALTAWVARMTDPLERKINTDGSFVEKQVESFMQQYPGLRQKTTTRDYDGQPIPANNQLLNAVSPVRVTNDRTDGTTPEELQSSRPKGQVAVSDKTEKNDKGEYVARDKYDTILNAYEKSDSKHGLKVKENTLGNIQNYDNAELKKAIKDVADEGKKSFTDQGLPFFDDMKADSTFARDYASFRKGLDGKDPLKVRENTKGFFKETYKNQLDEVSKTFYSLGDDEMRYELSNGTISKEQMDKLVAMDNLLTTEGLQDYMQIGKELREDLGYGVVEIGSGASKYATKAKSKSTAKAGSKKASKFDYSKMFAFGTPATSVNKSLRALLEDAKFA